MGRLGLLFAAVYALTPAFGDTISDFTIGGIQKYLDDHPEIKSVEKFIPDLPADLRTHFVLLTNTESAQLATAERPRVLLHGLNSSVVFAYSTVPDDKTIEIIRFDNTKAKFEFHRLDFKTEKPKVLAFEQSCQMCHGKNPRPNWDAYESWPNALPFNKDRLYANSEEEKALKRIFTTLKDDPRFSPLILPSLSYTDTEKSNQITSRDGTEVEQGGQFILFAHPNAQFARKEGQSTALFDQLTSFNALRVAEELVGHDRAKRFQYVTSAVLQGCIKKGKDFESYLPPAILQLWLRFHQMSYDELVEDTTARRNSLNAMKLVVQRKNLKALIMANARSEQVSYPTDELERKITRELLRRNMTVSHFPVDRETEINNSEEQVWNETLAKLRFVLEPEGVAMGKWSMSVKSRSLTYTFADLFRVYDNAMKAALRQSIGELSCAQLSAKSLAAY